MKQTFTDKSYTQWIPDNLPASQVSLWGAKNGLHYEDQNNYFHLDIEKAFPYGNNLKTILNIAWKKDIANGDITVTNSSWRTRYTFMKFPVTTNKSKMLDIIEEEYGVVECIKAMIISPVSSKASNKTTNQQTSKTTTPIVQMNNFSSSFRTLFKTLENARANIRILKKTKLNSNNIHNFKLYRDWLSRYADKNDKIYPKYSDARAWFIAEEIYKYLNSNCKITMSQYQVNTNTPKTSVQKLTSTNSFKSKVMNHYGASYTPSHYDKEYTYSKSHGGKCTWEDPNYANYLKELDLLSKIEQINRPVREHIKKNMKAVWEEYEYKRKRDCISFSNKTTEGKLKYAKYCNEYIKNLVSANKIPSSVVRDWKYWVFIK